MTNGIHEDEYTDAPVTTGEETITVQQQSRNTLLPFLILGIMLNTIGIVLPGLGWARYVLMFAGLGLILFTVLRMIQQQEK